VLRNFVSTVLLVRFLLFDALTNDIETAVSFEGHKANSFYGELFPRPAIHLLDLNHVGVCSERIAKSRRGYGIERIH